MTENLPMPFAGDCRKCGRHIRIEIPATKRKVNGLKEIRGRCANCGTTNLLENRESI